MAVIGAGISGLACAQALVRSGCAVKLFEKSRGAGGRASTRRRDGWWVDHGAQYFTVRSARFAEQVATWERLGISAEWQGRIVTVRADGSRIPTSDVPRYVGVPGMSQLARELAADLNVTWQTRVDGIHPSQCGGWRLRAGIDDLGTFDGVVSSAPAPQTSTLLREVAPALADTCDTVDMLPCWAVLAVLPEPLDLGYEAAFIEGNPLVWIARDSSKPQRPQTPEVWVLHAGPTWSAEHIEDEACDVEQMLLGEFAALTERSELRPISVDAHRWRYARSLEPRTDGCIIDCDARLAVCGDWLAGDRIEGAFLSGLAAGEQLADLLVRG
ncbi:MAG: FAD-dependent oxidoreductase [Gemmatimonadota bacterium]|nr:MAG: FAD-dependent oxidoreductase [Gemmatimonadota bacterium]